MRLLLIGDLHLRAKRLNDVGTAWSNAVNWAHRNGVDVIIQAGDVFNHANVCGREASTGTVYDAFLSAFRLQETRKIPVYAIPGNHDMSSPRDKDALAAVDMYDWMHVVRKPSVVVVPGTNLSICAVPWLERVHLISKLLAKGMKFEEASGKVNTLISGLMESLATEVKNHAGQFVLFVGHLEVTGAKREGNTVQKNGSFEFSSAELAAVGADAYALAHIHIRQHIDGLPNENDGYLGTLCQLSFGEEKNAVGCRLLDIDGKKIVQDRWLDNGKSPRYFTVLDSVNGLDYRKGVDYVKLRALTKPESLPEGVMFERLPQAAVTRLRTGERLDSDMSLRELLTAWGKIENCKIPIDVLVKEAESVLATIQVPDEFIGSIESVDRIKIKNVTCHQDTDILLDVRGICGLCGPNGSGKTTAMEAIMLALYGISPSRPIPSLLPKGDSVNAFIEVDFVSSGTKYKATREFKKTAKTFNQKASIFRCGDNDPIASSDKDVYHYSCRLVGDSDLVLAGIFSSQGDSGNIVKLRPALRKDLFAKLLGTEKFRALSKAAEKIMAADSVTIDAQKARIATVTAELSKEEEDKKALAGLESTIKTYQAGLADIASNKEKLAKAIAALLETDKARQDIVDQITKLETKRGNIQAEGRVLKQKKAQAEQINSAELERELADLRRDRSRLDEINEKITKAREEASIQMQRGAELQGKAEKMLAQRAKNYSEYVIAENGKIVALKNELAKNLHALWDKVTQIDFKLLDIKKDLGHAKTKANMLKGFPDLQECRACPLAKDGIVSRDNIALLEQRVANGEAVLEKAKAAHSEAHANLNQVIADAEKNILPEQSWQTDILRQAEEYSASATECIEKSKKTIPAELKQEKSSLEEKCAGIVALENRLRTIADEKAEISKIDALLDVARKQFKEVDDQIKAFVIPPEANQTALKQNQQLLQQATNAYDDQASLVNGIFEQIGEHKARLKQHDMRRLEIAKIEGEIKGKVEKIEIYDALVKAFCRDGIPQLIVDSAIPHLNDIMYEMMSECDGKWTIRVSSQHFNRDGEAKEQIDILVDDGNDERDILTYSGGEKNLLEMIVRIGFSRLQSERSGKGLKVLIIDEPVTAADEGLTDAFMRMLRKMPEYFNQIFFVSHNEHLLSSIQNKIFFALTSTGKTNVQTSFCKRESNEAKTVH